MTKNGALIQLIVTMVITLLYALNNGMAQTHEENIRNTYFDNIIRLTVEALNDSCINIAHCEVPVDPFIHGEWKLLSDSGGVRRSSVSTAWGLKKIKINDMLRGNVKMDTFIVLNESYGILREGMYWQFPSVNLWPCSEWIMFLDSPFLMNRWYHSRVMEKIEEYDGILEGQINISTNNYFTLYEWDSGALCTYFPEDEKYPPKFIYSEGLVDDFRTIIKLQEDRSLLTETADSYEDYYNSIKEELSRRVFSQMFKNPDRD